MTRDEAREAKREQTPVHVPLGMGDAHYGVIRQIGGHDSGNDDLCAVQGAYSMEWFHYSRIREG